MDALGLEVDQLQLERLVRELDLRLFDGGVHTSGKPLPGLDDLLHALLEGDQILRGERLLDGEVVVEAVPDRRPDTELGFRELLLNGLRQHVGG